MAGKHYSTSSQPYKKSAHAKPDEKRTAAKKPVYDDMYSYEEPHGAKRGTRQSTVSAHTAAGKAKKKKRSNPLPTVLAVLCLLASLGILAYIVWDLGLPSMLSALLG